MSNGRLFALGGRTPEKLHLDALNAFTKSYLLDSQLEIGSLVSYKPEFQGEGLEPPMVGKLVGLGDRAKDVAERNGNPDGWFAHILVVSNSGKSANIHQYSAARLTQISEDQAKVLFADWQERVNVEEARLKALALKTVSILIGTEVLPPSAQRLTAENCRGFRRGELMMCNNHPAVFLGLASDNDPMILYVDTSAETTRTVSPSWHNVRKITQLELEAHGGKVEDIAARVTDAG